MPTINTDTLYAQAAAIVTAIAGQVVALVPSWAPFETGAISLGSFALAVAIIIAHAIRNQPVAPAAPAAAAAAPAAVDVAAAVRAELAALGASAPTSTTAGS